MRRLLIAAVLAVALAVLGAWNPGHLLYVEILLDHPLLFGAVAVGLLARAAWRVLRSAWAQVALVAVTGLVVLGLATLGGTAILGYDRHPDHVPSPDRRLVAVVSEQAALIDSVWTVRVETRQGILSRVWYVACLSGDDPADALHAVTWAGPDRLRLRTEDGRDFVVGVDRRSGRPRQHVNIGAC